MIESNQNNVNQPISNKGIITNPIASGNNKDISKQVSYKFTNIEIELKNLLEELKDMINCSELEEIDKEDALEEIEKLVIAFQNEDNSLIRKANRSLNRITSNNEELAENLKQRYQLYYSNGSGI